MRKIYFIDLFCGAGGVTTGIHQAECNGSSIAEVLVCVNHDPIAIESHACNHPDVLHYTEDIKTLDLSHLQSLIMEKRIAEPDALIMLWASLECTNFSKAKGGLPRNADSRTLAEHLDRYIEAIDPDYIWIENVEEFLSWGPLDDDGKPLSRKNGRDFMRWKYEIESYGYDSDYRILNCADFGAYTSRKRLFIQFAKSGLPISWPEPTHSKKASSGMFGELKKWKAVKDVLNFNDEGKSIFTRETPLSDKTLERIYAGLIKYVANGDTSFLAKYFSGKPEGKVISTDGPAGTIKTKDSHSLIQFEFILKYNSTDSNGNHNPPSIDEPAPTVTCQNRLGLVQPKFLQHYYGNGFNTSIEDPCPTLTTIERAALVEPQYFIDREFKSVTNSSIEGPVGAITTVPKMSLVEAHPFIMPTKYNNKPKSIDEPCPTIMANRKHHYLVNPQFNNGGWSIDKPCFTLIAKMDKRPPYLVEAESGHIAIAVYETDSEMTVKIKHFMAVYGLIDIKMRMLKVSELKLIQGFKETYILKGNQSHQKKFIGNSVPPPMVKALIEASYKSLYKLKYAA